MSALPPITYVGRCRWDVRKVPRGDVISPSACSARDTSLLWASSALTKPCARRYVDWQSPLAINGINATQGNSILPLYLPPSSVSVSSSRVYVPPPLAPTYLPVPPVFLYEYSLRCEPSSQVKDIL